MRGLAGNLLGDTASMFGGICSAQQVVEQTISIREWEENGTLRVYVWLGGGGH